MKRKRACPKDEAPAVGKVHQVTRALQLPVGALTGAAQFQMSGNREVIVEGCKGVLEYDDKVIRINTGKMVTSFQGRGLCIKCLTPDSLVIEGFITSIEFVT